MTGAGSWQSDNELFADSHFFSLINADATDRYVANGHFGHWLSCAILGSMKIRDGQARKPWGGSPLRPNGRTAIIRRKFPD